MSVVSQTNKQMLFDLLKSISLENQLIINENQLTILLKVEIFSIFSITLFVFEKNSII